MADEGPSEGWNLERYRPYLELLARLHLEPRLRPHVDAADLAQEAIIHAHKGLSKFRGQTEAQLMAWLRTILAREISAAVRRLERGKRDVNRKRSLEAALEQSSACLAQFLVADQSSPSQRAQRHEQEVRLAEALTRLPEKQREAVTLHHLQNLGVIEVAQRMSCTKAAAAGYIRRGLEALRQLLADCM